MEFEKKMKTKREEILEFLKKEKITYEDWESYIKNYIEQRYRESTL